MKTQTTKFSKEMTLRLPILLLLLASHLAAQSNTIHVNRNGSAAPNGSSNNPYHLVEAGVCKAQSGDRVSIQGGIYNELLTIGKRVTLTASGGSVVIGQVIGKLHTTLKVLTYNTHLFGDEALGLPPTFADNTRSRRIAERIHDEATFNNVDVVGLQEVWDEERANVIINHLSADYPHYFYGNERDERDDFLHSGLLLLSKHSMSASLIHYRDEVSITQCDAFDPFCPLSHPTQPWVCLTDCVKYLDAFASKGFIQAAVVKDGFSFGIFVTHTQAESHSDAVAARRRQLNQLGSAISACRLVNPGAEVIVMGDFNVNGENSNEYLNDLVVPFLVVPLLELNDAAPNAPCFDSKDKITSHAENDLNQIFSSKPMNQRLDYIFYSRGNSFDMLPLRAEVKKYKSSPPITEDGKTAENLSDHYAVLVEFSIYR